MDEIDKLMKRHSNWSKISAAFLYAIAVSVAMNFFWKPSGVYASGITGFAQLIATTSDRFLPFQVSIPFMYFALNVPLFILAWFKIGHHFTLYTFFAVIFSTIMMRYVPMHEFTSDPVICAIFGGVINGFGTGMALKSNISTGGLDILGIVLRKRTGKTIGTINIAFNAIIVFAAGFIFGWPHALYSALSIFINGKVMDVFYTRQQKLQVMIVTNKPKNVIKQIQEEMRRGITIVHDAEGAYKHEEMTILFTVISRFEMYELEEAMQASDPYAFVSITESVKILGHFYETPHN